MARRAYREYTDHESQFVRDGARRERTAHELAAMLLERRCRELGHPPSACGDECLCGLQRYD